MDSHENLIFNFSTPKQEVLDQIKNFLTIQGYTLTLQDENKPWGGYFYIDEKNKEQFAKEFFKGEDLSQTLLSGLKLTPKILIIQPSEILSWQWHERRSEIWRLIAGDAGYIESPSDEEPKTIVNLEKERTVRIPQGMRHRLVGTTNPTGNWGIVAEIWENSDIDNPSNEDDIHRLTDRYSRS